MLRVREETGLSLEYYDVVGKDVTLRATDNSPSTGYLDPGYVVPASADKPHANTGKDSWSVTATVPAGPTILSQAREFGLNLALYGVFPATYDRVLDLLNYRPEQCKASGRSSVKCADATSSVTVKVRGSSAKITVKAQRRDILIADATELKAYLWLENGDNILLYNDKCQRSEGVSKAGIKC